MLTVNAISKKILTEFKIKHKNENLAHLDLEISMYPYGVFDEDRMIGVCEFIDTSITTKILHIHFIYLTPEYRDTEYMQSLFNLILGKYTGYTITVHPTNKYEVETFRKFGFTYDDSFYYHESNTMKYHPWFANVASEKMIIGL